MKDDKALFTFILAHYEQYEYIFTALDSILAQTYSDIEVIVMDDQSYVFDKAEVEDYLARGNRGNIKSIQVLESESNIGTVRSMNRALRAAKGEYIQMFAADDRLHDERCAELFVNEFERLGDGVEIIAANAMLMDMNLKPPGEYNLLPRLHKSLGRMDAQDQFETLCFGCCVGMGGVCVRTSLYRRIGYFNERYFFVEDWPFFVSLTRDGVKIHTMDFVAFDHRDGGISRTLFHRKSPNAIAYQQDILVTFEREILPFISRFTLKTQHELIEKYYGEYGNHLHVGGIRRKLGWRDFRKYSKGIVLWRFLAKWRWNNARYIATSLRVLCWVALLFFVMQATLGAGIGVGFGFALPDMAADGAFLAVFAVMAAALAVFIVNICVWAIYRIYRMIKEGKRQ